MRFIHDIDYEPEVSAGGHLYGITKSAQDAGVTHAAGFHVEILILAVRPDGAEDDALHLHGNAKHVRRALLDALEVVEHMAASYLDEGKLDPNWADAKAGA